MNPALMGKIKAFLLLGLAIFFFLSLTSYHPDDTSFRSFAPNIPVKNLTGIVGSYLAEGLFFCLGQASYLICLLLLLWAVARFRENPAPKFYFKILASVVLLLSLAVLLNLVNLEHSAELRFQRSGLSGIVIADFLIKYFGSAGSLIICLGLGMLSSVMATEFLILSMLKWTGVKLWHFVLNFSKLAQLFNLSKLLTKTKVDSQLYTVKNKVVENLNSAKVASKTELPKPLTQPLKLAKPKPKIIQPKPVEKPILAKAATTRLDSSDYKLPSFKLLNSPPALKDRQIKDDLEANSRILEATLRDFGVETNVTQVSRGPAITRYELEPAPGVKVHRIVELSDDIALAMKAHSVRIVAPIPGKARVGVEVPNSQSTVVYLRDILESSDFQNVTSKLTLAIGKDISGQAIVSDLADMPHLLIAGTTGSGKTVCVNSIIMSLLFNATDKDIRFLMVDPKMVELAIFNQLPHLLCPVLTNAKKVSSALAWIVKEMDERYKMLAKLGTRNIDLYNEKIKASQNKEEPLEKMPYIIVIIDELADLMVVASQQIEDAIARLAQLSRAVGIHLILATQRPSVDVITGVIKANFPARISFRVASKVDSRTVLDANGADKLLGNGDLLFLKPGEHKPIRVQGSLISDAEIERVVGFITEQKQPVYNQELLEAQEKKSAFSKKFEKDEFFDEAVKVILQTKQASVSMLQRRLGLGYTRAARLIDMMEDEGIVGPYRGSRAREILIEKDSYNSTQQQDPEDIQ